jgi:hypothetical protein
MNMSRFSLIISGVFLTAALSSQVGANQGTSAAIESPSNKAISAADQLMEVTGVNSSLKSIGSDMLMAQLQANPSMKPYKQVIQGFVEKHLAFEHIQPKLRQLYMETFSAEEMAQLVAFHQSPLGQKAKASMQTLRIKGAQIGAELVQANLPELQALIKAEAARIEGQQAHSNKITDAIQSEMDNINKVNKAAKK